MGFEANGLLDRVAHLSDAELISAYMLPGGHDHKKIFAAFTQAEKNADTGGRPTVILAKTLKGFSMATFQGRNTVHQQKSMKVDEMLTFRDVLELPLTDEQIKNPKGGEFFRKPAEDSPEVQYMLARRKELGGFLSRKPAQTSKIMVLPEPQTYTLFDAGSKKQMSTTMAFAGLLRKLMKSGDFGKRCVPMITDEARTFGLNSLFHEFKIHAPFGQQYLPVDHDTLMKYAEAPDGQILQEGISEAGALASWINVGTSYASQHCPMMPFFIYYSMFGFQRVGDLIWQGADARARGFLLGATGGRTTLNGEGLQHQDGHSMPEAPKDPNFKEGLLKGLYKCVDAEPGKHTVRLVGSGSIMQQVLNAVPLLAEYGVSAEVWSATNIGELHRDAVRCDRHARLNPKSPPMKPWVSQCLGDGGVTVACTDNQIAFPQLIQPYVGGDYVVLGTDGF